MEKKRREESRSKGKEGREVQYKQYKHDHQKEN